MIVGLCEENLDFNGFIVRTIGLDALEGYRSVKWAGGVDFFIEDEEKLKLFVERYKDFIYAIGKESMEEVVGKLLREKGLKLATAESCTAGLLSARLVNVPGSSQYFLGGFVVYANELKTKLLGVEEEALRKHGAVSEEVCRQMAIGVLEETDADIAIAITGISGPEGGTEHKPVGLTYMAFATDREVVLRRFLFQGSRNENRFMATQWALEILRRYLTKGV
ncbi:nicotinamide-nucleotide amidohydrolase family protein [Hydrogenobacter sp. T-2]|uniref:CinA family protein n=1 Tax=Pampinifervens diazotrophicum TaxID=1632018 RepID=UPI002B259863|nr:nicotinamide-nucleotide amidohydrolase family protein [Hydrogenobacter sp. T-2]WPM31945.1 nicotinamide-nucleotide amidohydrolase family protein [Hydrogenobacter sp. T-2]